MMLMVCDAGGPKRERRYHDGECDTSWPIV